MTEKTLMIGPDCKLVITSYTEFKNDLTIEYKEHSGDYWHSDTDTVLEIDKAKAEEIVLFLKTALDNMGE